MDWTLLYYGIWLRINYIKTQIGQSAERLQLIDCSRFTSSQPVASLSWTQTLSLILIYILYIYDQAIFHLMSNISESFCVQERDATGCELVNRLQSTSCNLSADWPTCVFYVIDSFEAKFHNIAESNPCQVMKTSSFF